MAGSHPQFNPTKFRDAIRSTMTMGLPGATDERATFRWSTQRTFNQHDTGGRPFDFGSTPVTENTPDPVQIPVAVEYQPKGEQNTAFGDFESSTVRLTILDVDYPSIFADGKRADIVEFDGNSYEVQYVAPPLGLFDVTIYQLYAKARDES